MNTNNKTTIKSGLRMVLATAAILSTTAFAQAAGPFVAGSHWSGFQVSAASGVTSAQLDVSNNPTQGMLALSGQSIPVTISCSTTGAVELRGLGIPYAGVYAQGTVAAQGGTFALAARCKLSRVSTLSAGAGRLSLLRSYATLSGNTTGGTSAAALFPPNPCSGSFTSAYGTVGRMVVEQGTPAENPERTPLSDFHGKVFFGDFSYAMIGTINPVANADGSHDIAVLGENLDPSSIVPCFSPGEVVPCFHPGDLSPCFHPGSLVSQFSSDGILIPAARAGGAVRLVGRYALSGVRGTVDTGKFQLGQ